MSFLSGESLKYYISHDAPENERIIIAPKINDFQIGQCSIDLRLAPHIIRLKSPLKQKFNRIFNPSSNINSKIYEKGTIEVEGFVIKPNELIIARSIEIISLPNDKLGLVTGRSSFSRLGLEIQLTQDLKQPGHNGVVLFQIKNNSTISIRLFPEMRIAQIMIATLDKPCNVGYDDSENSKYANDLDGFVSRWQKDKELQDKHVVVSQINFENLLNLFIIISLIFTIIFLVFKNQISIQINKPIVIAGAIVFVLTLALRVFLFIRNKK